MAPNTPRSRSLRAVAALVLGAALVPVVPAAAAAAPDDPGGLFRPTLSKERFYFAMADRFANGETANDSGGLTGDRLTTGLDPASKGFYQGGDLAGILQKLDYIQGMGTTAIWLTPSFQNRPVQGTGANAGAGYHGYWITDFTRIDPHLGTNAQMKQLVKEAHKRGMKVFFDIITNHTADVISTAENRYSYRSKASYPLLDTKGHPFDEAEYADGTKPFPRIDENSFPYTPVVPQGLPAKVPAWLNDTTLYHNRGDSTFAGENAEYGDFYGLDDLMTENPRVVKGMTDIYEHWIKDAEVDGFRIDTAKHVNIEFWQRFAPAIQAYAAGRGNPDFFQFGEVYSGDPKITSRYVTEGKLPSVLDFPFQEAARAFASGAPADRLRALYAQDDLYTDADSSAYSLPTFLGNHDMGRIGGFIARDNPGASDAELLRRDQFAHQLMYLTRGQPVIYYGDEQGYTGDGGDTDARTSLFASKVPSYLDDDQIGTTATAAQDNYVPAHPLYQGIKALAELTTAHPALRDGAQIERLADGGVYAFSRISAPQNTEYVVAVNSGTAAREVKIPTFSAGTAFAPLYGASGPAVTSAADKTITVPVPPQQAVVYRAQAPLAVPAAAPSVTLAVPATLLGRAEITASVPGDGFDRVAFQAKIGDGAWQPLGADDNRSFRVFHSAAGTAPGTRITYRATVIDSVGRTSSAEASGTVGEVPAEPGTGALSRDRLLVHYQRQGGYDGWTARFSGDVEEAVEAPFAGEDDYGRFAWVKLKPGAKEVKVLVHDGEDADGTEHTVNVLRSGEIWLKEGSGTVSTSVPYATVHYRRADGDYTGWGLHLWGDALADGVPTDWSAPRPPDGTDSFGAYWRIPLKSGDSPLNYIVHKGDQKDTGDLSLTPAAQPRAFVVSGDAAQYRTSAAARGVAVLHYRRPAGDYDGWTLHTWTGAAAPTEWDKGIRPSGTDAYGAIYEVPLAPGATTLSYILHKDGEKDLPDDQSLDLATYGNEVWSLAAAPGYLLPQLGGAGLDADLSKAEAVLTGSTVAWKTGPTAGKTYALAYSLADDLAIEDGDLTGDVRLLRLTPSGEGAFTVDPRDLARLRDKAVRFKLVALERGATGGLLTATGVTVK
ncbi:alpha-amylase family glycosyl hydrolase [Actinocorallia longicatena]|uniref:Glycosyl hydrolase family 13 catalytic domain-containing protein n=1 Tax=Actinocorallia longicatena TaxID=111803 RepID=A0ABP6QCI1_9ACTN